MPHNRKNFAVILEDERIGLFSFHKGQWINEPIQQENWHSYQDFDLVKVLTKLTDKINRSSLLEDIEIVVIYTQKTAKELSKIESIINDLKCHKIQILRYEPLHKLIKAQGSKINKQNNEIAWYLETFLSRVTKVLLYTDTEREKEIMISLAQKSEVLESKDKEIESKEKQKQNLELECLKLRDQIDAMQRFDNEQIVSFLPIFYRNFWNSVSPTDVALLLDTVKPIEIPSPFPEPSSDTIATKKKRFKQLPSDEQKRILGFCKNLTHKLEIRQEFKSLFGDNDD